MNASAAIADPLLRRAFADGLAPRTLTVLLGTGGLLVWRLSLSEERDRGGASPLASMRRTREAA